jgi:hypothetical protein
MGNCLLAYYKHLEGAQKTMGGAEMEVETSLWGTFLTVLQPISFKDKISRQRRGNIKVHSDREDTPITGYSKNT